MATQKAILITAVLTLLLLQSLESAEHSCEPKNSSELIEAFDRIKLGGASVIKLLPKIYTIDAVLATKHSNITLNGSEDGFSVIECNGTESGLNFISSHLVTIHRVTIRRCGFHQTHTENTEFNSAVCIFDCGKVVLTNVIIRESSTLGLSIVNCNDDVIIQNSHFSRNIYSINDSQRRGGGVYISLAARIRCIISDCQFEENRAFLGFDRYPHQSTTKNPWGKGGGLFVSIQGKDIHVIIETIDFCNNLANAGGGLFVEFKEAEDNLVEMTDCHFQKNRANTGGGLSVEFTKGRNNQVVITDCCFMDNSCMPQKRPPTTFSKGGGMSVFYPEGTGPNNTFVVNGSHFINNSAYIGGGLFMETGKSKQTTDAFLIDDCIFEGNSARIGSAIDLNCYFLEKSDPLCMIRPTLRNINVTLNHECYQYQTQARDETFATIHLQEIYVIFQGHVTISNNSASGIGLDSAILAIACNATVAIKNNSAKNGGGIAIIGDSQLFLHPGVELFISFNRATNRGGGIYTEQTLDTYSVYDNAICFVKHIGNDSILHPNHWNVNVTFKQNLAAENSSSIFASSIFPCVQQTDTNSTQNIDEDIMDTFCKWKGWNFPRKCQQSIQTLPNNFSAERYNIQVYPFSPTLIEQFAVFDDLNHDVTSDTAFATKTDEPNLQVSLKNRTISVLDYEKDNTNNLEVLVETTDYRGVSTTLNLTVMECPVAYELTDSKCQCKFKLHSDVLCNGNLTVSVFIGHCLGYRVHNGENQSVISKCPYNLDTDISIPYMLYNSCEPQQLNKKFCAAYSREGYLCSSCIKGRGIDIFSPTFKCIKCNHKHSYLLWLGALASIIGPQTIFLTLVIVFHIGITSPTMNAYIFFSHVIAYPTEILLIRGAWKLTKKVGKDTPQILTQLAINPYRIWNFDYPEILNIPVCVGENVRGIHAIAFRYVGAFYPIFVVVLTLVFIELHAHNVKPVVKMKKVLCYLCVRMRRNWEIRTSVLDAFATVILLSYSKIITTSLNLLKKNNVYNLTRAYNIVDSRLDYDTSTEYFRGHHLIFAGVAIFIFCTFGIIPPLLLMCYPYRYFQRLLEFFRLKQSQGLHVFVEIYHGSYKDGTNGSPDRRWFAGVYFIFRIIIFMEFTLIDSFINVFEIMGFTYIFFLMTIVVLKPYKKERYNVLDALFMANLVTINFLSYYLATYVQLEHKFIHNLWYLNYILIMLPTAYLLSYSVYYLCTRSKSDFIQKHCISNAKIIGNRTFRFLAHPQDAKAQDDKASSITEYASVHSPLDNVEIPDRINNPHRYFDMERSNRMAGGSFSSLGTGRERERLLRSPIILSSPVKSKNSERRRHSKW